MKQLFAQLHATLANGFDPEVTVSRVSITEAKTQFSALVRRAERGERIAILRRGKVVAELSPPSERRQPIDIEALRAMTAKMPIQAESSGDFIRRMRDDDRY